MQSDATLSDDVKNAPELRQYTGKFDVIPDLRNKTALDYPYLRQDSLEQLV